MENKELVEEIISIVHKISGANFKWDDNKRALLIKIRNEILDFQKKDNSLQGLVIYLNGIIRGLYYKLDG